MLKESVFAEDMQHWPFGDLHHVYNFPITELEIVCMLPYCIDEKSRWDRRDPEYSRSPRLLTGRIPRVYLLKCQEWPAPESVPLVLGMWGSQEPLGRGVEVDQTMTSHHGPMGQG